MYFIAFKMSSHQTNKDKPRSNKCRHFCFQLTHIITALPVGNLARVMTSVSLWKTRVKYVVLLLKNTR